MLGIKMDFQAAWVKIKVTVAIFRKKTNKLLWL